MSSVSSFKFPTTDVDSAADSEVCQWLDEIAGMCAIDLHSVAPHVQSIVETICRVLKRKADVMLEVGTAVTSVSPLLICLFRTVTLLPRSFYSQVASRASELLMAVLTIAGASPLYTRSAAITAKSLVRQMGTTIFSSGNYSVAIHEWLVSTLRDFLTPVNVEKLRSKKGGDTADSYSESQHCELSLLTVAFACLDQMVKEQSRLTIAITPPPRTSSSAAGGGGSSSALRSSTQQRRQSSKQTSSELSPSSRAQSEVSADELYVQRVIEILIIVEERIEEAFQCAITHDISSHHPLRAPLQFAQRVYRALHAKFLNQKGITGDRLASHPRAATRTASQSAIRYGDDATPIPASVQRTVSSAAVCEALRSGGGSRRTAGDRLHHHSSRTGPPRRAGSAGGSAGPSPYRSNAVSRVLDLRDNSQSPPPRQSSPKAKPSPKQQRDSSPSMAPGHTVVASLLSRLGYAPTASRITEVLGTAPSTLSFNDVRLLLAGFKEQREDEMEKLSLQVARTESQCACLANEVLRREHMVHVLRSSCTTTEGDSSEGSASAVPSPQSKGDGDGTSVVFSGVNVVAMLEEKVAKMERIFEEERRRFTEQVEVLNATLEIQREASKKQSELITFLHHSSGGSSGPVIEGSAPQ